MATQLFENNASAELASGIDAVTTSIPLATGYGALFPSPTGGDWFMATLVKATGEIEIVKCTGRSGDLLTVVREQEGTTAKTFSAGDICSMRWTKGSIEWVLSQTKITGATSGNLAGLDTNGNLTDSGVPASGVTQNTDTDISGNSWVDTDVSNNLSTKVPTEAAVKSYVDANGGGNISAQMFYTSGTDSFTVPPGVTKLKVTVVGGGGGGGDANRNNGGTGGLAIGIVTVTPAEVVPVTVGAGGYGANSTYGSSGGDSSFGSYVSATGGSGGTTAAPTNGTGYVDAAQQSIRTNISTKSPLFGSSSTRARNGTTNRPGVDFDPTDVYIPGANGLKESGPTASDASGGVGGMVLVEWVG